MAATDVNVGARRTRRDADPSAAQRAVRDAASAAYAALVPTIRDLEAEGLSLNQIARRLNAAGHRTRHGATMDHSTVRRILLRATEAAESRPDFPSPPKM